MLVSKIERELLKAVDFTIKPKKDEDRPSYLSRLMRRVSKLKDSEWNALSTAAQDWNNDAATAYKNDEEIQDFPDVEEVREPEKTSDSVEVVEQPQEADIAGDNVFSSELKAEEPPTIPPKDTSTRRNRRQLGKASACRVIKHMVLKNPKVSVKEIAEKLKSRNMKVSDVTVYTLRYDVRDTLRAMNDLGMGDFDV